MGEVYKARDERLARDVAITLLAGHPTDANRARERFKREAQALAALQNPTSARFTTTEKRPTARSSLSWSCSRVRPCSSASRTARRTSGSSSTSARSSIRPRLRSPTTSRCSSTIPAASSGWPQDSRICPTPICCDTPGCWPGPAPDIWSARGRWGERPSPPPKDAANARPRQSGATSRRGRSNCCRRIFPTSVPSLRRHSTSSSEASIPSMSVRTPMPPAERISKRSRSLRRSSTTVD